jgi:hypothetical protein
MSQPAPQKNVLIAAVADRFRNDSCLMFAISMLKLQALLARVPGIKVTIVFVHSEAEVHAAFKQSPFDDLIVLHTMHGFDPEMVFKMIATDKDCVIGIYPLPGINFEAIKEKTGRGSDEETKYQGLVYNCTVTGLDMKSRYARVKDVKDLKIYKMTKKVDSLADWVREKTVYGDVEHQCTSFGQHDFIGCVGLRKTLR